MRNNYIVTYDISEPKRLRNVYNLMRGYGNSLQYSVFSCELSGKEKMIMITELYEIIKPSEDSILIIDIGSKKKHSKIETLGIKKTQKERKSIIL
ncbi:MAG: CRISPR-associated endonuclease Cas2 [Ferroplasma sp.]|uniref:CRISPR-associated endonuclease Cas2 n=1 Tax=Ferroplasma sp. TaxID=2591003 RepID=UPI0028150428|nr:CRISPR-associated endonuclease Cas2 [Ferroplasma sp.]WMT50824.1 MAG: CRISPR-associated endonuclease Cas2 [Ferroplasma sp.]